MNNGSPKRPTTTLLLIILMVLLLGVNARKGIHPSPLLEAGSCQADSDGDAVCESTDNCPLVANAGQEDQDSDGVGDACDACPTSSGAAEDTCLGPGTWETRPGNSVARSEAGLVEVGGSLYLIAGENTASVEIYNVATRTWTTGLPLPSARNHIQAVTVSGKIYVLGGLAQFPGPSLNQNLMFDPQNPALGWQTRAPLPTSRGSLGCAVDGIKIYCAGGLSSTAGNTAINVMEVYDTVANTWATLAPMPRDRDHFQAEIIGGKFYAVSGRDTTISAKLAFNDIYNIATNTWSQGAQLPTPRGGYASEVIQGRLLIIGGEGGGPSNGTFPNVEEYDPRRNSWRALANIPTPRHGISGAISTVETGNPKDARLYVISGGPSEGGSTSTVNEVFYFRTACSVDADCNDGNTCTTDICVTGACQRTNNTASCNDGVACTSGDVCSGGFCAGTNNCTGGQVCNLGTGQCGPPGPAVTSFTLINADSDLPIASFDPLAGGAVLNLATLPTQNLNVRANTSPATVGSVVFGLDGNPAFRIESGAPYALAGDVSGNYNAWTPSLGSHALTGTAWTSAGGTGTPGPPLTINFTVVNQASIPNHLGVAPASVDFGQVAIGTSASQLMTLTNLGGTGSPTITISNVTVGGNFSENITPPVVLAPGASTTFNLTFLPPTTGLKTSTLQVTHSATNSPVSVPVQGTGFDPAAQPISFNKSVLQGTSLSNPTTLQFGPDGRLYVGQQNGTIAIFTIVRNGPTNYAVTATQTLSLVKNIPNHNDNGTLNTSVTNRQLTGLLVTGTPSNPILYATSSDPRIGGDSGGTDTGLDTNSGVVSRLTWNGTSWVKLDLVRGLPRSEENHSANGLQLDPAANKLYVAQGGNTNMGAPSNNFALLPEYALSAAILSIDLTAIGNTTYDLPTLDDPARPGVNDANDPFGGNDAANQAKLVPGGPVQVYSPGFRNSYDVLITSLGRMYTIDNGPNGGWGDVPAGEGTSTCTNAVKEPGVTQGDGLHFITGPGYYGGHPNPTRANPGNTFNGQSPVSVSNAVECDYRAPGPADGSLAVWGSSTNGLTEYTASNFGGLMQGDLLATSFNNTLQRVKLNAAGTATTLVQALFSNVGANPLDVTAQGNSQVFPGTIWVANHGNGTITVYDPVDFLACTGADNPALDEDQDGYDNADEIDNGTSPCSAGDIPPDRDGDFTSDLNDPDDDNDTLPDVSDPFAIDPANGTTTNLPVNYSWDNNAPNPGGLVNLGFTGLMTNGTSDYEALFDPENMTAGGAAGVATVDLVPEGDALGGINTQQYGFQFGLNVSATSGVFTAHTRILAPFAGLTPQDFQSMGLFLGSGTQ
ncbi:MAG: hypothetical protein L0Z52_08690, partial [Acidobacteria bacterium]|nr:hypothetical protein [Acidobacteriota bacterium]